MKEIDAYHIDPAIADVIAERMDELRAALAISEADMRRLREACEDVMFLMRAALDKETNDEKP